MSGPASGGEVIAAGGEGSPATALLVGRRAEVGGLPVTRLLPRRQRRTIGAWCFLDRFGPAHAAMRVGPHPHIGLATVTWLLAGEVLHRDSLGSEQLIRQGQLNLMSAGDGVAHAEESAPADLQGLQLWVAQPEATRHGSAAFEHHASLPEAEVRGGTATVLLGELAGVRSPARTDTPIVGAEVRFDGTVSLPVDPAFEHGVVAVDGDVLVEGVALAPDALLYLGTGREEVTLAGRGRALLLGGTPFESTVLLSWNFVARTEAELDDAHRGWASGSPRFGSVASPLPRVPGPRR